MRSALQLIFVHVPVLLHLLAYHLPRLADHNEMALELLVQLLVPEVLLLILLSVEQEVLLLLHFLLDLSLFDHLLLLRLLFHGCALLGDMLLWVSLERFVEAVIDVI